MIRKNICIGGTIGVGKSTLINSFEKNDIFSVVKEFDSKDNLIQKIIENTYSQNLNMNDSIIQMNTCSNRWINWEYSTISNKDNNKVLLFDRGVIDPLTFSSLTIKDEEELRLFNEFAKVQLNNLFKKHGKPFYVLLVNDDEDELLNRVLLRDRLGEDSEVSLRKVIHDFDVKFLDLIKEYEIEYTTINVTGKTPQQVREEFLKVIGKVTY